MSRPVPGKIILAQRPAFAALPINQNANGSEPNLAQHQQNAEASSPGQVLPQTNGDTPSFRVQGRKDDILDGLVMAAMTKPKDRMFILMVDRELEVFLRDPCRQQLQFPPMTSYHRLIIHRIATYFGLNHYAGRGKRFVIISKRSDSHVPVLRFMDFIEQKEPVSLTSKPIRIMKRQPKSNPPTGAPIADPRLLSASSTQTYVKNAESTTILKSPANKGSYKASNSAASSVSSSAAVSQASLSGEQSPQPDSKPGVPRYKSIEEKEAAYQRARARIFQEDIPEFQSGSSTPTRSIDDEPGRHSQVQGQPDWKPSEGNPSVSRVHDGHQSQYHQAQHHIQQQKSSGANASVPQAAIHSLEQASIYDYQRTGLPHMTAEGIPHWRPSMVVPLPQGSGHAQPQMLANPAMLHQQHGGQVAMPPYASSMPPPHLGAGIPPNAWPMAATATVGLVPYLPGSNAGYMGPQTHPMRQMWYHPQQTNITVDAMERVATELSGIKISGNPGTAVQQQPQQQQQQQAPPLSSPSPSSQSNISGKLLYEYEGKTFDGVGPGDSPLRPLHILLLTPKDANDQLSDLTFPNAKVRHIRPRPASGLAEDDKVSVFVICKSQQHAIQLLKKLSPHDIEAESSGDGCGVVVQNDRYSASIWYPDITPVVSFA